MGKRSQMLSLLGVAVISGAIYFLVQGVQTEQSVNTQALTSVAKIYVSPSEKVMPPSSTFSIFADIPTTIKSATLSLRFDSSILQITKTPYSDSLDIINSTDLSEANSTGQLIINFNAEAGVSEIIKLVNIDFETITDNVMQTTIHVDNNNSKLFTSNNETLPIEVEHANISIRP